MGRPRSGRGFKVRKADGGAGLLSHAPWSPGRAWIWVTRAISKVLSPFGVFHSLRWPLWRWLGPPHAQEGLQSWEASVTGHLSLCGNHLGSCELLAEVAGGTERVDGLLS